jgi:hypothetical protein
MPLRQPLDTDLIDRLVREHEVLLTVRKERSAVLAPRAFPSRFAGTLDAGSRSGRWPCPTVSWTGQAEAMYALRPRCAGIVRAVFAPLGRDATATSLGLKSVQCLNSSP